MIDKIKNFVKFWDNYKFRFVPWLSLHMKDNKMKTVTSEPEKTMSICVHRIKGDSSLITDSELSSFLNKLFSEFEYVSIRCSAKERREAHLRNADHMYRLLGFNVERQRSKVSGSGVFVQRGTVKTGSVVALYPGTIYLPSEPLFFASIFNQFIFRCKNGLLIDGNDKRLSKSIYKGCGYRDQFLLDTPCCDMSWLTQFPLSPLNIGQYVNNESRHQPHNVVYQECQMLDTIPYNLWRFLPNVWYNPKHNNEGLKLIPLVAVRDINEGEELFSSYFTVLYD